MTRQEIVTGLRLRSGHNPLNNIMYLMKRVESPNCDACGKEEDQLHIVMDCVRNQDLRIALMENLNVGCFTCCLNSGLRVYNVDPLVEKTHYSGEEVGAVLLCEMVQRSNWLLVVRARRPRALVLLDDSTRSFRAEVVFKAPIEALRARVDKVAVVLSTSVHVLALPSLTRVALLRTPPSARPLCALASAPAAPHQILAAPAHRTGSLQILEVSRAVSCQTSSSPLVMSCHRGALACVAVSSSGWRLATASERGTLLRVWDASTRTLLHELRRGADAADLYCINFDQSARLLCCVSDKGTLHVWRLGARGSHTRVATARAAPDQRTICAFLTENCFVAICHDGTFHKFTYSTEGGSHRDDFEYFLQVGDDDDFIQ